MGAECPNGHGRQNIIANITADGSAPIKNSDVIASKLHCGCVVGGADFEQFQLDVLKIRTEEKKGITAAKETARKAIGAAFKGYTEHRSE
jgi:hypothetical protein